MGTPLRIVVEGVPVAKGRPKFTTVNGHGRSYTPAKTRIYENWVQMCGVLAMSKAGLSTLDSPVVLEVEAVMPIPTSWSKKRQRMAAEGEILPAKKPDLSNICKAVEDGLNGIVFRDDSQIVRSSARKLYGSDPKVVITITELRSA